MFNVFLCFLIKLLLLLLLLYLPKPCTDMLMVHNQCFHFMGVHLQDTACWLRFDEGISAEGRALQWKWRGRLLVKIAVSQANFSTFYYNSLIQHYRKRKCIKCGSTPDDPAVCLVCGKFTCLQGNCCVDETAESRHYECIQVCHVTSNLVSATTWIYWFELQN